MAVFLLLIWFLVVLAGASVAHLANGKTGG